MTKLAPSLPAGDGNGLAVIARDLVDTPGDVHVVIALIDCKRVTTDTDTGDVEPTARIRRIEAVRPGDVEAARGMLRRALDARSGAVPLVDIDTGELL